mgnify:FL=1|tara:strand:- start:12635 stop:13066 length:432 start_codon:yes stop_codon:yes gene_type:complete
MQAVKGEKGWSVRLDLDQPLFASLEKLASEHHWHSGFIWGLGALKNTELGFYHLDKKTYDRKVFAHEAELLSLTGNLASLDGKPFFHLHAVLGGPDFNCFGGHLFSADIAVTCELFFCEQNIEAHRVQNDQIGLKHLDFCGIK